MIHIYCGDGKGKTTAAVGLAVRAAGSGLKVLFVQFLKGRVTGELSVLKAVEGITVIRAGDSTKFTYELSEEERTQLLEENQKTLDRVFEMTEKDGVDLLILDEIITAVSTDMIHESILKRYVDQFNPDRELVMTGRSPERWMVEMADYVTDMEKIRHPFDQGIRARKGIEF